MRVIDVMLSDPPVLAADLTLKEAIKVFAEKGYDLAFVVDQHGRLVGSLQACNLLQALINEAEQNSPIGLLADPDCARVNPEDDCASFPSVNCSLVPVVDERGHLVGAFSWHNCKDALDQLSRQMWTVVNSTYNAILGINCNRTVSFINRAAEKTFGVKIEDAPGIPLDVFLPDEPVAKVLKTGVPLTAHKIVFKDRTLMCNLSPIWEGEVIAGAVAVFQDISDLEKISEELNYTRRLKEQLDTIFEHSHDYIFVTDEKGKVLRVNPAYSRITGLRDGEIVGRSMYDLVRDGYYDRSSTIEVIKTLRPVTFVQTVLKTGKKVLITGSPIFDEKGNLRMVITNGRDITELEQLREEVERAKGLTLHYKNALEQVQGEDGFVIKSQKMKDIMLLVRHVAGVDSTVLIQGESGVGKEIIAREIHANSPRRDRPYLRINCASIPETLLESELFGYEAGAFTGAKTRGKMGIFELANGGTLLLDEISEMPLGLQAKILRVIQENEFTRVGGTIPIRVDVRLIASTNRNLWDMVIHGEFRKDLFYRLNVVPIQVPPLRERPEEIPALVNFFLQMFNKKYGLTKSIDPSVIHTLATYQWPGNVRELKNVIERAAVTTPEDVITRITLGNVSNTEFSFSLNGPVRLKEAVREFEKNLIASYISKYRSTRKTAGALGVSQTTICRKATQYGIRLSCN